MERNRDVLINTGDIFRALSDPDSQIVVTELSKKLAVTSLQMASIAHLHPDRANEILGILYRAGLADYSTGVVVVFNTTELGLNAARMVKKMHMAVRESFVEPIREENFRRMR